MREKSREKLRQMSIINIDELDSNSPPNKKESEQTQTINNSDHKIEFMSEVMQRYNLLSVRDSDFIKKFNQFKKTA